MLQVLLPLLVTFLFNHLPSPSYAGSRYGVTVRKGGSSSSKSAGSSSKAKGGSKASKKKRSSTLIIGHSTSGSALVITAIIVAVIVILILAFWWWQKRRAREYIKETEKLATRKYSIGIHSPDREPVIRLFSHADIKQATNDFASDRVLGRGSFGDVDHGILDDETPVAIKCVKTSSFQGKDQVLSEVQVLSKVNHAHLVRLLGFCVRWKRLLLVYEYAPNGSLSHQLVHKDGSPSLDWKARLQAAIQSAEALAHLHSDGSVCHGDVKSNNILLDQSMNAKVSDYGLLRFVDKPDHNLASKCVHFSSSWPWVNIRVYKSPHSYEQGRITSGYLDPEYQQYNNINQLTDKSDVYSFGVVLLELVTPRRALEFSTGQDDVNIATTVRTKKEQGKLDDVLDPELMSGASEETVQSMRSVVDLALECVQENGLNTRPAMKEVAERLQKILSYLGEPQVCVDAK